MLEIKANNKAARTSEDLAMCLFPTPDPRHMQASSFSALRTRRRSEMAHAAALGAAVQDMSKTTTSTL
eukprot:107430-Amphidinium_carterae.1